MCYACNFPLYECVGSVLSTDELLDEDYEFPVATIYRYDYKRIYRYIKFLHMNIMYLTTCACFTIHLVHTILLYRCTWVKIDGEEYKILNGVIVDVNHDLPIVGVIRDIQLVNGDKVMFHIDEFQFI